MFYIVNVFFLAFVERAFSEFYCSPVRVAIRPDESLLLVGWNVGVAFKVLQELRKDFIATTDIYMLLQV